MFLTFYFQTTTQKPQKPDNKTPYLEPHATTSLKTNVYKEKQRKLLGEQIDTYFISDWCCSVCA